MSSSKSPNNYMSMSTQSSPSVLNKLPHHDQLKPNENVSFMNSVLAQIGINTE